MSAGLRYYPLAFLIPQPGCTPLWEVNGDPLGAFTSQVSRRPGSQAPAHTVPSA